MVRQILPFLFSAFLAISAHADVYGPYTAGQFYPSDPIELGNLIDKYVSEGKEAQVPGRVRALIAPHAGYQYSGPIAGSAYRQLGKDYRRFIILGANHNAYVPPFKAALPDADFLATPLGNVKVSAEVKNLLKDPLFAPVPAAFQTHIIEVQLPFLQRKAHDFEIIPVVLQNVNREDIDHLAQLLIPLINNETAVVVSSDLSHYFPYEKAIELDRTTTDIIVRQDSGALGKGEACGLPAIAVLLEISKAEGWKAKLADYRNSGDTSGTKSSVVGYSAIVFYQGEKTRNEKLIDISRQILEHGIRDRETFRPDEMSSLQELNGKRGCFVTLRENGMLRGCIGTILPEYTLGECIIRNTLNAALNDTRFDPVRPAELPSISLEISILDVPAPLKRSSPEDLLEKLRPLKDGVILERGMHLATYLPQVWEELADKKEFLGTLCMKGGMEENCWKDPATEVRIYGAEVITE